MIYGVLSDVHSNFEAMKAVLNYFSDRKAQGYICCGDMVGYGPQPNECIEAVSKLENLFCVNGNHDLGVLGDISMKWFNSYAGAVIQSTIHELTAQSVEFLKKLPKFHEESGFTIVHGSPRNPSEEYLITGDQYLANAEHWKISPCFIGHSHLPLFFSQKKTQFPRIQFFEPERKLILEPDTRYMINPGSVGQPRDRDPRASCGIYDSQENSFEWIKLKYPVQKTQNLMWRKGIPQILIDRLSFGW